jgi:ribonuclease/clavin/mitogillin
MIRPRAVAPDVGLFPTRTITLPPATHTNSYALGGREVLLVEPATPFDDERRAWLEWARELSSSGRTLMGVFLTHHHFDHASSAALFARELSLPLFLHPLTRARLDGLEETEVCEIGEGHRFLLDGTTPHVWSALHTPGHAPGHLCLHDQEARTLVAGDMVANGSTILIPPDDGGDMAEYLAQLDRLDALATTLVLPAHGAPIDDPHALFRYYVEHRLMREAKVFAAHQRLADELGRVPTVSEMIPLAYDDAPPQVWPLAMGALEAHVIKLRREGRIA